MPVIEIDNIGPVEFPDSMSDADIVKAIETDPSFGFAKPESRLTTVRKNFPHIMAQSLAGGVQALAENKSEPSPFEDLYRPENQAVRAMRRERVNAVKTKIANIAADIGQAEARQIAPIRREGWADPAYFAASGAQAIGQMIPSVGLAAVTRNPAVGAAAMTGQAFGSEYQERRTDQPGRPAMAPEQAREVAMVIGALEGLPEVLPLGVFLKAGGGFFRKTLKSGVTEGVEEMIGQALQLGYQAGMLDERMPLKDAILQVAEAGIIGSVAGAGIGAGLHPFTGGEEAPRKPPITPPAKPQAARGPIPALPAPQVYVDSEGRATVGAQQRPGPPERDPAAEFNAERERIRQAELAAEPEELPVEEIEIAGAPKPDSVQILLDEISEANRRRAEQPPPKPDKPATLQVEEIDIAVPPDDNGPGEPPAGGISAEDVEEIDITAEPFAESARAERMAQLPENFKDPRLAREFYRGHMADMLKDLVKGGGVSYIKNEWGEITGRTSSVNPEWFKNAGWTMTEVKNAATKALAGEKLGTMQSMIVATMLGEISGKRKAEAEILRDQLAEARRFRKTAAEAIGITDEDIEQAGAIYNENEYREDWDAETRALSDIANDAMEIFPAKTESILQSGRSDAEVARSLLEIIHNGRKSEAGVAADLGKPEERAQASQAASAEADFQLEAGRQEVATKVEPEPDLFGGPTQNEINRAGIDARRKEVAGKLSGERESLTGKGDLFDTDQATGQQNILAKKAAPDAEQAQSKPAEPAKPAASNEPARQQIDDVGEKIGGARKDVSVKTGERKGRGASASPDKKETSWRDRYFVMQSTRDSKWRIFDRKKEDRTGAAMVSSIGFDTEDQANNAIPLAAVSRNHSVRQESDGKFAIWRRVAERKSVRVIDQRFDSSDDGIRYMAEHAGEIVEIKTGHGEEFLAKPKTVNRKGPERRNRNVDGEDFRKTFGFRGVEFGNWQNQEERQEVLNHAYDGLLDLAEVLGIPPLAISMNGELALAFGARGHGLSGARAHYEVRRAVINLTKMSGAGALAHEWMHGLDHYFGRQADPVKSQKKGGAGDELYPNAGSGSMLSNIPHKTGTMREELRKQYADLVRALKSKAEKYVDDSKKVDKFLSETRDDLAKDLATIREDIAVERRFGAKKKAATAKQLAEFDRLSDKILSGDTQEIRFRTIKEANKRSRFGTNRMTNDDLEALSAVLKEVTGRSGFSAERSGYLDRVRSAMLRHKNRANQAADAAAGTEKTKNVATRFAMNAKEMDQGRSSDYWALDHEMMARAFSAFVEDAVEAKGGRSDFLSFGSQNKYYLPEKPFPEGEEREALNKAFAEFFAAVRTKETEQGVAIYEREPEYSATLEEPKVEQRRKSYGVSPAQLALFPEEQQQSHLAARKAVSEIGQGKPSILGNALARGFRDQGHVSLIGQTAKTHADLAAIAQVYRDPRYETLRYFVTDANGKIVYQSGVSARMPGYADLVPQGWTWEGYSKKVSDSAKSSGGSTIWLLHNHPSGKSNPSPADVRSTTLAASEFTALGLTFGGHVIIDTDEYSLIDKDGGKETLPLDTSASYSMSDNSVPHQFLGNYIGGPTDVARIGKSVAKDKAVIVLIGRSSRGEVNLLAEISPSQIANKRAAATLRALARKSGSREMFATNVPASMADGAKNLMRAGFLRDAIMEDGTSLVEKSGVSVPGMPGKMKAVAEPVEHYRAVSRRIVDRIDRAFETFGNLPGKEEFLAKRYLTLGRIAKADEAAKAMREAFLHASADTKRQVYEFMTTDGADPASITNDAARRNAVKAKAAVMKTGQELVDRGMIPAESYEALKGAYLPRLYLKYLLDEKDSALLGAGKKPGDMGYLKKRKDIPADVREVLLGEVKDPGFLAAAAIARPLRDMALLDWFSEIASVDAWAPQAQLVTIDGKRATPWYWREEADRLREQARHQDQATAEKARAVAERYESEANKSLKDHLPDLDVSKYRQMPNTPRYGLLRGLWVRREIYDDVVGISGLAPDMQSWPERLLGYGGIGTMLQRAFKTAKVGLNPPGHVRNFVSNMILLNLSGVPIRRLPGLLRRAINEIKTNGRHWQIAKKYGATEATFSAQEMLRLRSDTLDLLASQGKLSPARRAEQLMRNGIDWVGDKYQLIEAVGKTMKIIDAMEREGLSEKGAALEAQKWLFDYSMVPRGVRYLRNAPVGAPFITFAYKVAPRLIEVALHHPQRFAPYAALFFGLPYLFAAMMDDVDKDDLDALKEALPEWLRERGHAMMLPVKDDLGRWQFVDLGYFMPWSMYTEAAGEVSRGEVGKAIETMGIISGPVPDLISAIKTGVDPFTDRKVYDDADPPGKQAASIMAYTYQMMAPPWLTGTGWAGRMEEAVSGRTDRYGTPRTTETQAMLRLIGFNVYGIDPELTRSENIRRMMSDIDDVVYRYKTLARQEPDKEKRKELLSEYKDEVAKRQKRLKEYAGRSKVAEALR